MGAFLKKFFFDHYFLLSFLYVSITIIIICISYNENHLFCYFSRENVKNIRKPYVCLSNVKWEEFGKLAWIQCKNMGIFPQKEASFSKKKKKKDASKHQEHSVGWIWFKVFSYSVFPVGIWRSCRSLIAITSESSGRSVRSLLWIPMLGSHRPPPCTVKLTTFKKSRQTRA